MRIFFLYLCLILAGTSYAQELSQTIRGVVLESDSRTPLPGASVAVYRDSQLIAGTTTDANGLYRIEEVPVGRYFIVASYIGYNPVVIPDIIVNTGKQSVVDILLEESITRMEEVVITAGRRKGETLNEMASVSARAFSVDESERYAGSRGDPARMASNFAGVVGNNDNSNDIIVRGNSPIGLLWRMEGVNIPNPNHFSVAGNTGGPVTLLNNQVLSNSDFYTGAWPAEYGNAVAGVFDLRLRNGNNEKREFQTQVGFLGMEFQSEGPFSRKAPHSYLISYRYSTLALFNNFGVNIGTDAVPRYQDLSMKLNFSLGKKSNLAVFGIGGISGIDIIKSDDTDPSKSEVYGNEDADEHFYSSTGVAGVKFTHTLNENTYLKATLSTTIQYSRNKIFNIFRHVVDQVYVLDSLRLSQGYHLNERKEGLSLVLNRKVNVRHTLRYGVFSDVYHFDFVDSIYRPEQARFETRINYRGTGLLVQPYIEWQYRIYENLKFYAGLHGQYFNVSRSKSLEPRLGLNWTLDKKQSLSFGFGQHSQMIPTYVYFNGKEVNGEIALYNKNLDFIRSNHLVIGYNNYLTRKLRMKVESYYQRLYNVPVSVRPSSYSVLNEGDDLNRFFPDSLLNAGIGRNYGVEFTLEKFFGNHYFFLFTSSLFDSKYRGSDGNWYNTVFNSNYVLNLLGTREFTWGSKTNSTFGIGGKITFAGGKRYTPIDTLASEKAGEAVFIDTLRNTLQTKPYFRADLKINYKLNAKSVTHEFGLDLVNVFNTKNIFKLRYVGGSEPIREEYQLGFLPIFYYRIDF